MNIRNWKKTENKFVKNIKYNCKPLFKYVKSKTNIHKNVSTIKNDKTGELTKILVETASVLKTFFNLFILWKSLVHNKVVLRGGVTKKLWMN